MSISWVKDTNEKYFGSILNTENVPNSQETLFIHLIDLISKVLMPRVSNPETTPFLAWLYAGHVGEQKVRFHSIQ